MAEDSTHSFLAQQAVVQAKIFRAGLLALGCILVGFIVSRLLLPDGFLAAAAFAAGFVAAAIILRRARKSLDLRTPPRQ